MKIHLPNSAFIGNIDPFLAGFDPSEPNKLEITANEKWISIHPVVLSMVAALSLRLGPEQIICPTIEAASAHYLTRMGLNEFLKVKPSGKAKNMEEHEPAGRFIPLTVIKDSKELSRFLEDMIPLLHLHLQPEQAKAIRYVMYEVVRNVFEHSKSKSGAIVCAQYFKKNNTFRMGIADTGIGIRESIGQSYPTESDMDAIRLALRPGVTGTTKKVGGTADNAGAGLFFTKSIAYINRAYFMIYSGTGFYKLRLRDKNKPVRFLNSDPFLDNHSARYDLPNWHGTVVGVDISLNNTSEFQTLLNLIHTVYSGGVKDKRRAKYKRARFL